MAPSTRSSASWGQSNSCRRKHGASSCMTGALHESSWDYWSCLSTTTRWARCSKRTMSCPCARPMSNWPSWKCQTTSKPCPMWWWATTYFCWIRSHTPSKSSIRKRYPMDWVSMRSQDLCLLRFERTFSSQHLHASSTRERTPSWSTWQVVVTCRTAPWDTTYAKKGGRKCLTCSRKDSRIRLAPLASKYTSFLASTQCRSPLSRLRWWTRALCKWQRKVKLMVLPGRYLRLILKISGLGYSLRLCRWMIA